ncbi:oligosaccharyl transferase subunit ost3/OST6 [Coniosporium tulheliwenetii]|uniref:Oligosaccharyl transferase subunit ost3/OST6 n=1 Tax=Coniosporium tulheliwenetii TaxID=3383036 RepID=A0ACC2ZMY2_9PEZI|nr:oligosaccharyl transferase subunit ost3/OST6 [Cladosporium sp. JES 115]
MRILQTLAGLLLPLTALAAKKPTEDRFSEFRTKSQAATPIKLNDDLYTQLTTAPRDYAVAVLLTALESRFGCQLCREFQPEWDLLARSWTKGTRIRFDFTMGAQNADTIHAWLSRHLPDGPHPRVVRPINWVRIISITTGVLGAITLFAVAAPYIIPILQNRNLWAAFSLIAVLLFTSGHMFNHIRKVPYVSGDGRGGISYFAGGFQNQFGLETQIVAAMYGVLAFAAISLALKVPRMADPKAQQIAVFVWGGIMLGMYSFLLSVFRLKNGGYPFWLPPF